MAIPKIIHYCWFGRNPKPELAVKCMESWKKYCPDYTIMEWNEDNFDIDCCPYVREAYDARKWAFVSDVARLYALVHYGGIYMDTDVELLKPIDAFLTCEAFSGFEAKDRISTGLMACCKEHPLFRDLLQAYADARFVRPDGSLDLTTNVTRITGACLAHGLRLDNTLQTVCGFTLFPSDYFCPKSHEDNGLRLTENTHAIHWFDGSWIDPDVKKNHQRIQKLNRIFGENLVSNCCGIVSCIKAEGIKEYIKKRLFRRCGKA